MLESNISTVQSVSQNSLSENVIKFKSKEDFAKVIKSDGDLTRSNVSMFKTIAVPWEGFSSNELRNVS